MCTFKEAIQNLYSICDRNYCKVKLILIVLFIDYVESVKTQPNKSELIENDENDESDIEDSTKVTKFTSEYKKDIVKDDEKDEESRNLLPHSSGNKLFKNNRKRENCNRPNIALDDDEHYAISKIIDDVTKLPNENLIRPRITFLDFAGQSLYYAFHQIYLSPKTCYILVVDMTKSPKEQVREPDVVAFDCKRFKSWTYTGNAFILRTY